MFVYMNTIGDISQVLVRLGGNGQIMTLVQLIVHDLSQQMTDSYGKKILEISYLVPASDEI
jgi:hypothetical protein